MRAFWESVESQDCDEVLRTIGQCFACAISISVKKNQLVLAGKRMCSVAGESFHAGFQNLMTMTESSSESALREKLSQAQDETRQAKANLDESVKRVAMLEAECAKRDTADEVGACFCAATAVLDDRTEVLFRKFYLEI